MFVKYENLKYSFFVSELKYRCKKQIKRKNTDDVFIFMFVNTAIILLYFQRYYYAKLELLNTNLLYYTFLRPMWHPFNA